MRLEIDVHWVQRARPRPGPHVAEYPGLVDLVYLKDYRIGEGGTVPEPRRSCLLKGALSLTCCSHESAPPGCSCSSELTCRAVRAGGGIRVLHNATITVDDVTPGV